MKDKNQTKSILALILRVLGLLVGITAITLQIVVNHSISGGFMNNHIMAYFTVQTNIFSTLIFAVLIFKTIKESLQQKQLVISHINSTLHLACTFYITITMFVYWCVLAPILGVQGNALTISNNIFLHGLTPLFAILDTAFFLKHGELKIKDVFKWLIYPVSYLLSIILIANISSKPYYRMTINGKEIKLMYPYPFLEPEIVGIGGMIGVILALFVGAILFGMLYIFIDNKLAKRSKTIQNEIIE